MKQNLSFLSITCMWCKARWFHVLNVLCWGNNEDIWTHNLIYKLWKKVSPHLGYSMGSNLRVPYSLGHQYYTYIMRFIKNSSHAFANIRHSSCHSKLHFGLKSPCAHGKQRSLLKQSSSDTLPSVIKKKIDGKWVCIISQSNTSNVKTQQYKNAMQDITITNLNIYQMFYTNDHMLKIGWPWLLLSCNTVYVGAVVQCIRCLPHAHKVVSSNPSHGMEELGRSSFTTASPYPGVMGTLL